MRRGRIRSPFPPNSATYVPMSEPPENLPDPPLAARSRASLLSVFFAQSQNAFNDNFVKIVLISLTAIVAAGTTLAKYIEDILAALIPLPFILLAPLAGWLSDRYAKSSVMTIALISKVAIFGLFLLALTIRSIPLALVADFLFLVQSTLFSPAKQGIVKEIVGSKRLGAANGQMQMFLMVGILGGMALAGWWFDKELVARNAAAGVSVENGWKAAFHVFAWGASASLMPVLLCLFIPRTPDHPEKRFHASVLWSHFGDLKYLVRQPVLRRTGLFIAFYWFVANFVGLSFFGFAKDLHPDAVEGGVAMSAARMFMILGGGLIVGSLVVSFLSRNGNRPPLAVLGGLGMAAGLAPVGLLPAETHAWYAAIVAVGFSSGFFLVPLSAHLQDKIAPDQRGRVLSAQNLLVSLSGIAAILASTLMKVAGISVGTQTLVFAPPIVAASFLLHRMLKSNALQTA